MSKRNGKRFGLVFLALVVLAAFGIKVAVSAQPGLTDSDVVAINAEVQGAIQVDQINSPIELGILPQGFEADVPASGSPDFDVAQFTISGPPGLDWVLTVDWAPLVGPEGDEIAIGAPDGSDICFDPNSGTECDHEINTGNPITSTQHNGDGQANVGYSIAVPNDAEIGLYTNAEAITLTAEVQLGS